jgi:hypothetical protein
MQEMTEEECNAVTVADHTAMTPKQRDRYYRAILRPMIAEGYVIDLGGGNYMRTAKRAPKGRWDCEQPDGDPGPY